MGEHMRRRQARAFRHRGDAAYEARLASPDLLTGLRTDSFAAEFSCDPTTPTSPPCGERVVLQRMDADRIGVVCGNKLVGIVDSADAGGVGAVLDTLGGAVAARVERHATIGNCFSVRVDTPQRSRND